MCVNSSGTKVDLAYRAFMISTVQRSKVSSVKMYDLVRHAMAAWFRQEDER